MTIAVNDWSLQWSMAGPRTTVRQSFKKIMVESYRQITTTTTDLTIKKIIKLQDTFYWPGGEVKDDDGTRTKRQKDEGVTVYIVEEDTIASASRVKRGRWWWRWVFSIVEVVNLFRSPSIPSSYPIRLPCQRLLSNLSFIFETLYFNNWMSVWSFIYWML